MAVQINTQTVTDCSKKITSYNKEIQNELRQLSSQVLSLTGSWKGNAANRSLDTFRKICNVYEETRYAILEEYSQFLLRQVSDNYEKTEASVQKLASLFK